MDPNTPKTYDATGGLIVAVSAASGALPLAGALVTVQGSNPENSGILRVLVTDESGRTPKIELPTPPAADSESPGKSRPYAAYHIYVNLANYYPQSYLNVPVFAGVTSIQPAALLPVTEYGGKSTPPSGQDFIESENPEL